MPVNKEELAKDLETPEYQELVKTKLTEKKFVVRDEASDKTYLENYKKDVLEKEIGPRIAEVHTLYDKDIKELFGVDRTQDEKSYDYLKRAAKGKLTGLEQKITELTDQIKKGDPTGALTKKLEEAEALYQKTIKERDDELATLKGQVANSAKATKLMEAYVDVKKKFKASLPAFFAKYEKQALDEILAKSVLGTDGKLYQGDGSGGIKKDASFNPVPIEKLLIEEFKDVIDDKAPAGGAGSGKGSDNKIDPNTLNKDNFERPAEVKTQEQLMTYMLEIGLVRGTKVFNEIYSKHGQGLPLS